jgi:pectin methylesterase-like acyl-CoA thioesterase
VLLTPVTTLASPAVDPARVVWVAESGDNTYPLLSEALAAIDDASSLTPYVIKIAPGTYTETSPFALKTYVDVEGSGQGTTAIKCACSNASPGPLAATVSVSQYVRVEIRDLAIAIAIAIAIAGPNLNHYSIGVYTTAFVAFGPNCA